MAAQQVYAPAVNPPRLGFSSAKRIRSNVLFPPFDPCQDTNAYRDGPPCQVP